jgi:hypothetical protein
MTNYDISDLITPEEHAALRRALTQREPLGPSQQELLDDVAAGRLLDHQVIQFRDLSSKPYMLLLGRKGAGKSSMLAEIRLKMSGGRRRLTPGDTLPKPGDPFVIPVMSWEHFLDIAMSVSARTRGLPMEPELVPAEFYKNCWYERLWDELIRYFYNFAYSDEARDTLHPVRDFINADRPFAGPADMEAKRLFEAARRCVLDLLNARKSRLYFLFDSMERYPVRNPSFTKTFGGLFPALNKINSESDRIQVSFCIPEEIETFLGDASVNFFKDFASSCRIRWRPIDLLRITAHRFRLAMAIHDPEFHSEIRSHDYSSREGLHKLFSRILPLTIENSLGRREDPIAYVIRHTQLLPRHVVATFNAILARNFDATGGYRKIGEDAVVAGVRHVQKLIAHDVLYHYEQIYPRFIAVCRETLPELEPICTYAQLQKLHRRMAGRIEDDIPSAWEKLFQMGVLGRSERYLQSSSRSFAEGDRYCYGMFHFNSDSALGLASDGEYCFHPVFSRAFGIARRTGDSRVVYPANVDMVTLS